MACGLLALSGVEGSLVDVVEAGVPRIIHYQGKITEPDGTPLTGDHTVKLRLYDAATEGAQLWEEQHQLSFAADDNGVFSLTLGSLTPFSTEITFNDPLWLTIEVDGGGEFSPRLPLAAASYAINADQLDGQDSASFLQLDASGLVPNAKLSTSVSLLGSAIESAEVTDSTLSATDTTDTFLAAGSGVTVLKAAGSWTVSASGGATGDITGVIAGAGLTGGGTSGDVTLAVDVGTGANQIVQLDASAALPAVSGANLTSLNASNLTSGTVSDARLSASVSLLGSAIESAEVTDTTLTAADTADTFLTAGAGVIITKGAASWDIAAVGSGGDITAITAGAGLTGGGTSGDVTIALSTPVTLANGGTGASTAAAARSNLGTAASGANSDITSLSGLTTPLSITQGGTGATTAAGARANLISCMPIGGVSDDATTSATFQVAVFGRGDTTGRLDKLWPVPVNGTLDTFRVFVGQAPGAGDTWTVTLRKNGADTGLSCTISGASAQSCTDTGAVSVVAGDRLGVQFVETGSAANTLGAGWSACFVPN
ncbi:MAG: hypothetical protein Q8R78_04190 [Candidatus Omnitrophota bacterium]|nr:hypothetical protein [Candidatus Omnitrophota bacterium]